MADEVKTSMGMTFKAFNVPNFAKVTIPGMEDRDAPLIAITELEPAALDALAGQWLTHLYANCARDVPWFRKEFSREG